MAIEFIIQASCPRALTAHEPDDESLSDAIQTVFPLATERAILMWNRICVPLSYKYDISELADDILRLLESMLAGGRGALVVEWPSSSFAAKWTITWTDATTAIQAEWTSVSAGIESVLASRGHIEVPTREFLAEWRSLLVVVERALAGAGYTEAQLVGLEQLRRVIAELPGNSELYPDESTAA